MRFERLAAVALALLLAAVASMPAPAGAARLRTAGWWWRAQTGQGATLPPPPHVPPGGLAVGNGVDGPTAISALRFELDDEVPSSLKLTVAERFSSGEVPLALCLTASAWFGASAGNWTERPEPQCPPVALLGKFVDDGTAVSFDLSSLPAVDAVDVLIVPDPDATEPFEISFEAPTAASLVTRPAPSTTSDFGSESGPTFSDDLSQDDFPVTFGDPITPDFAGSDFSRDAAPPELVPGTPDISRLQPLAAAPAPAPEPNDPRPLGLVILAAAAVGAVMLRRESLPAPRLLGPMAGRDTSISSAASPIPGGLGRFRRDRSGEPHSLV